MPGFTAFQNDILKALEGVGAQIEEYTFAAKDFAGTGGDWTEVLSGPAGLRGLVLSVQVYQVSEVFSSDNANCSVKIGDGSDDDAYAYTGVIGELAVGANLRPAVTQGATSIIPANGDMTVTGVQDPSVGSSPTGIASVKLRVAWFL